MKAWSFIFYFWICLNFAIIITNEMNILPYQKPPAVSAQSLANRFSLESFSALMSVNIGIGIVGVIFKQYIFATLAIIIWTALWVFLPIFTDWLIILPSFLRNFLPPGLDSLYYLLICMNTVMFFMFIVQLLTQRAVET